MLPDRLAYFPVTKATLSANYLTRITAFLVEQEGFHSTQPSVNETQANDASRADLNTLIPGLTVAAVSYLFKPVDWRSDTLLDPTIWILTQDFSHISIIGEHEYVTNTFLNM
ncbi:hypothetical protein AAHC03_026851 [Spirometra sp. Aus1]